MFPVPALVQAFIAGVRPAFVQGIFCCSQSRRIPCRDDAAYKYNMTKGAVLSVHAGIFFFATSPRTQTGCRKSMRLSLSCAGIEHRPFHLHFF